MTAAIARGVDMSGYGVVMIMRLGADVILITPPNTVHRDPISAANGRGCFENNALKFQAEENWTGAGDLAVGFDAAGRLYFESSIESFSLSGADALIALGFDGDVPLVSGAAPFRATASQRPRPGPFKCASGLTIDPSVSGSYTICAGRWYPDPITALRRRGIDDLDDVPGSLEERIHSTDARLLPVAVGFDEAGRTVIAWPSALTLTVSWAISPDGRAFRNAWGYRGDEQPVDDGNVVTLTAGRPHPAILTLDCGLEYLEPRMLRPADAHRKRAGGHVCAPRGAFRILQVEFKVEGPDGGQVDNHRHLLDRVLPARGKPLNIYPIWGDPRRALDPYEATVDTPAHSLVHTTREICTEGDIDDGYGGRFPGELALDNADQIAAAWSHRSVRLTADVSLTIEVTDGE